MKEAKSLIKRVRKDRRNLSLPECFELLEIYGIKTAKYFLAENEKQAVQSAKKIGYPVAMKAVSNEVLHKTDVGGVSLNLGSEKDVKEYYNSIRKSLRGKIDSLMVQEMISGGQEVIIGGKKDIQFGQTVIFGAGGIYSEIFDDVSLRVTPIRKKDAKQMISETKISKVLKGFRGFKYDVKSIEDAIMKVSKMLEDNPDILELDINPLIVMRDSKGSVAVDARIILE